jgi:uncharacterized protein
MKSKDLKTLSMIELRRLAKSLHVSLRREMSKQQIVKAVVASARSRAISATLKKKRQHIPAADHRLTAEKHGRRRIRYEEKLPVYAGITKLVLMPRDPWWVFAYWEVDRSQFGGKALILRVYRKDNQLYASISVGDANSWYINLPEPSDTIRGELGYMKYDGGFRLIAVSNTVITPRAWPSDRDYKGVVHKHMGQQRDPFTESYTEYEKANPYTREDITSRKR